MCCLSCVYCALDVLCVLCDVWSTRAFIKYCIKNYVFDFNHNPLLYASFKLCSPNININYIKDYFNTALSLIIIIFLNPISCGHPYAIPLW